MKSYLQIPKNPKVKFAATYNFLRYIDADWNPFQLQFRKFHGQMRIAISVSLRAFTCSNAARNDVILGILQADFSRRRGSVSTLIFSEAETRRLNLCMIALCEEGRWERSVVVVFMGLKTKSMWFSWAILAGWELVDTKSRSTKTVSLHIAITIM